MGQIRDWKRRKKAFKGQHPDNLSEKEVVSLVERRLQQPDSMPAGMTLGSLRISGDFSLGEHDDLTPEQGFIVSLPGNTETAIRWYEDVHRVEGPWTESELAPSDGLAPDAVSEVTVRGGKTFLLIRWLSVAHAHPGVRYRVHVAESTGFTPDESNLVTETAGNFVSVRKLADKTLLAYDTDYFIKIVALDEDGVGDSSPESTGRIDADAPEDLLVGTVTAEQLEAVLVMTTRLIAGIEDSSRVEMGVTEMDGAQMVGLHAFDAEDMITFMIDANTGQVYVKGRIDWGTGSELAVNDIMILKRQPIGFEIGQRVQSISSSIGIGGSPTASCTWSTDTHTGSLLLLVLLINDVDNNVPTPSTPAGWTLTLNESREVTAGEHIRLQVFKIEDAASRSGIESVTLNDTVHWRMILLEYAGVEVEDVEVSATGKSVSPNAGTTATTTQNDEMAIGIIGNCIAGGTATLPINMANPWTISGAASNPTVRSSRLTTYEKLLTVTGTVTQNNYSLFDSESWIAAIITFKSKVAGVETPDQDKLAVYAKDAGGLPALHVRDETGEANSLLMAPPDTAWRAEYYEFEYNPGNIAAHTSDAAKNFAATGVQIGDLVLFLGCTPRIPAYLVPTTLGFADTTDQITMQLFNADSVAHDDPNRVYSFLVFHRT